MNADLLDKVSEYAERYADYVVYGCDEIVAAIQDVREVATSMRAPITPEALKAAGWDEGTGKFGGAEFVHAIDSNHYVAVWFANGDPVVALVGMGRANYAPGVGNMHDLAEFVRLIGVSK